MLDVSTTHAFEVCAAFAVRLLDRLSAGDMAGAEALIDVNATGRPFAESFPAPDGFTYAHPDSLREWSMAILKANELGFRLDIEVRFEEAAYRDRPMHARFDLRRLGGRLEVRLIGLVPS